MKRIVLIISLLACSYSRAAITLVQSVHGGTASGTVTVSGNQSTSAVGFTSPTSVGNLLVMITSAQTQIVSGSECNPLPSSYSVATSGFTWTQAGSPVGWQTTSGGLPQTAGLIHIWYIPNAGSMSTTTVYTHNINTQPNGTSSCDYQLEFTLYEFSGVGSIDGSSITKSVGSSAVQIEAGTITTSQNHDLIVVGLSRQVAAGSTTAGTGYTLGLDASVAVVQQFEYNLDAPTGANATQFTGTSNFFSAKAVAFKAVASPAQVMPRYHGSVF